MRLLAVVVCALALLATTPVHAQSLLDRAGQLLRGGTGASPGGTAALSSAEIVSGLREALSKGTELVTGRLGAVDGFYRDPKVRIPLPDNLRRVHDALGRIGMGALGDEVELKMNRAAEAAMGDARTIVADAVKAMTFDDAKGILDGPDDAATQYLRRTGGDAVQARIRQAMDQSLAEVGAVAAMDAMLARYRTIPFMPDVKASLGEHATHAAMDGLFGYLAAEEAAIRQDPAKRTTDLLRRVFGG